MPTDCPANQYCKVQGCAATGGTCTPKLAISNVYSPVCGCDKITYWNESIAVTSFGTNARSAGECPANGTVPCNGANVKCPEKRYCNITVANVGQCGVIALPGVCWGVPPTCPAGGKSTQCPGGGGAEPCLGKCDAIVEERLHYPNNACVIP